MRYRYVGEVDSARFENEMCDMASLFGGRRKMIGIDGYLTNGGIQFSFPFGTNRILARWFNNIYGSFSVKETRIIWDCLRRYPQAKNISPQIWNELASTVLNGEGWHVDCGFGRIN
jgi:hypothetical protein